MLKTIWITGDTVCIGDTLHVDSAWEKVEQVSTFSENNTNTVNIKTRNHTVNVTPATMVEVVS